MIESMRVRLLVGKMDDESRPVVAASIDESIFEVAGYDSWHPEKVKAEWPPEYEWREIIVRIPAQLVALHFEVPDVVGIPERPGA